jgi:hypothetical protein
MSAATVDALAIGGRIARDLNARLSNDPMR